MTIKRRIHVTTGIIIVFVLIIGAILLWNSHEVENGIAQIRISSTVMQSASLLHSLMDEYLAHGDKRPLRQWNKHSELLGRIITDLRGISSFDRASLRELELKYRRVNSLHPQIVELGAWGGDRQELKALKETFAGMMAVRLEELANAAERLHMASQSLTLQRQKLAQTLILATSVLMIGIVMVNLYLTRKSIVKPLQELSRGSEIIGAGNFEHVVEAKSKDEVGKLAQAFNTMVARLKTIHDSLQSEVAERKAGEQAVTVERQQLYDVLETLPVYVCLLDSDYYMPFANRYFRETFGESQGRRCHEFLFNRAEPCEICETYTVMKTRAPHHWYWTGPNGRDYDIYDFPFIDTDGSFLILEMGIDITERKHAEDALKETLADLTRSNADLAQFAYVASHDLQEPLRNIASCVQVLEKKYKHRLDADADQYIQYAVESAVRMKALIQALLVYSRIGAKGKRFGPADCEKILDRTVTDLRSAISEAGAVITHDPLPAIHADAAQLSQVFQNLIGNAIKFRRNEPRIHISAAKNKNEWIFSVKDNGIGMESEYLERIFVIFQRLNKRSQYDGTGMGLAIVKKVVEGYRGRVWAESELGVGTTFYFTIPDMGVKT